MRNLRMVEEVNPCRLCNDGSLRDISPALLSLLKLEMPKEKTGGDMRIPIVK